MFTLLISGGYAHPFEESGDAIAAIAEDCGCVIDRKQHIPDPLEIESYDIVIINALFWSMTQHEKYAADREEWAFTLSDKQMATFEHFVGTGGSLLAMHTSVICFDTQPRWKALLGGGWTWGHSHHPPYGPISVEPTIGLPWSKKAFSINDEAYHNLRPADDVRILANVTMEEGPQPVAWTRRFGEGKVAVDALGHDAASINQPKHKELLEYMLYWLIES